MSNDLTSFDPTNEVKVAKTTHKMNPDEGNDLPPPKFEDANIRNMGELKRKAPELYDLTLKSMAMNMTNKMRKDQARLKKISRGNG